MFGSCKSNEPWVRAPSHMYCISGFVRAASGAKILDHPGAASESAITDSLGSRAQCHLRRSFQYRLGLRSRSTWIDRLWKYFHFHPIDRKDGVSLDQAKLYGIATGTLAGKTFGRGSLKFEDTVGTLVTHASCRFCMRHWHMVSLLSSPKSAAEQVTRQFPRGLDHHSASNRCRACRASSLLAKGRDQTDDPASGASWRVFVLSLVEATLTGHCG